MRTWRALMVLLILTVPAIVSFAQTSDLSGIEVYSNRPDARVIVNGEFRGTTEQRFGSNLLRISLPAGTHTVTVEVPSFAPNTSEVEVPEDRYIRHEVTFTESSRRVATGDGTAQVSQMLTGTITVKTIPLGAMVELDGDRLGATTNTDLQVLDEGVGRKHLEVYFDRNDPEQFLELEFELTANDEVTVVADFFEGVIYVDTTYQVTFNSPTEGATVRINDHEYNDLPVTLELPFGEATYLFSAAGYEDLSGQVTVNRNMLINRSLQPLRRRVSIRTTPSGAQVVVDGDSRGTTPTTITTTERSMSVRLDPPTRYPRLEPATVPVSLDVTQRAATVSHSFEQRPTATLRAAALDGSRSTAALRISTRPSSSSSPVQIATRYGQVATVESGSATLLVYDQSALLGTVRATLEADHSYELRIGLPEEPLSLAESARSLPGYQRPPAEPDYLPEYREERVRDGRDVRTGINRFLAVWMPAWFGTVMGGGIGAGIAALGDNDLSIGGGVLVGILGGLSTGLTIGWAIVTEPDYRTQRVPLGENKATNDRHRSEWQEAVRDVEAANQRLLEEHNAEIARENTDARSAGRFSFRAEIVDRGTGERVRATVSASR